MTSQVINPARAADNEKVSNGNTGLPSRRHTVHRIDHGPKMQPAPLPDKITDWFPLLPRTKPPGQALHLRVHEIRELTQSASEGPDEIRISRAAEALNKAALVASDCGLADLAQQLCWRQFDLFRAATPLTTKAAKLALQPIVNLGRLATRSGDGARAYRIFENAYQAVTTQVATQIDGRDVDFKQIASRPEECQELRRFLWTVLLADGTRALTKAGRWNDAFRHIERYKGIGKRMLDGRQVAILARCASSDYDDAIDLLDDTSTPEPWEEAIAACLRTLCLGMKNHQTDTFTAAMVRIYLRLEPAREYVGFHTRLGLTVIDLATDTEPAELSQVIARVIREAMVGADAHSASDVLAHELCRSSMTEADEVVLADIVESSGLWRGIMPADLLDDLMTSTQASETQLPPVLARLCRRRN
ncbi:MAG: hypothetical protein ACT4NY_06680 [Pseudonocardiales bacterium]